MLHRNRAQKPIVLALVSALAGPVVSSVVYAQDGMLEEVVVTARKREESLQETPVAITALGEDALREANIRDLGDLTTVVPGLSTRNGDKFAAFSIRGVGSRGGKNVSSDPAVGVYVDGIFLPRSDSQLVDVIAAESVQVLRGPQGTLFGKNTAGGALLITSSKPHEEFGVEVRGDFGNMGRLNASGNLNIPVTDKVFLRLTADSRSRDGYMDDANTGIDYGDVDRTAYAAQLRWLATDSLTVDLLAFTSEQKENAAPQTCRLATEGTALQGFTVPGDPRLLPELCLESAQLEGDEKVTMDLQGVLWEMESDMLAATLEWDLDVGTFKSISGYLSQDNIHNWRDQDASPNFTITNIELVLEQFKANGLGDEEEREFFSQEFQFNSTAFDDSLDYTIGLFYSNEDIDDNMNGNMLSAAGFLGRPLDDNTVAVLPVTLAGFRVSNLTDYDNETMAAFAQGSWHFDESWSLTVGGRYGVEKKEFDQRSFSSTEPSPGVVSRDEFDALVGTIHNLEQTGQVADDEEWNDFTPSVSLSYVAGDNFLDSIGVDAFMMYGTWSEGFKAGGFSVFADVVEPYDPENVTNYEIGIKLDALDNRLRFNTALYYMDYEDMQITVTRRIGEVGTDAGLANAGEATMAGVEAELSFMPTLNWFFQLSANYIDAEYDEFVDLERDPATGEFVPVDRSHEDFAFLPETTFSWIGQYSRDTDWGEFSARISGSYKDEVYIGLEGGADQSDESILDDYTLWNARLTWRSLAAQDLEISLYVDNLTDEEYFGTGLLQLASQGSATLVRGVPRTYGMQALYRY